MTKTISFFNHKGGVGKTTMLFNIAIEMGRLNKRVLMVDLDAQANLTAISLNDADLDALYSSAPTSVSGETVAGAFMPLVSGAGDVAPPAPKPVRPDRVWLVPGDIQLTAFEAILPSAWTEALAGGERGFRVTSAAHRMIAAAAAAVDADYVFIDLGPNVGALNRAVLLGSDYLLLPMASDLFSLRALPSVGSSLDTWVTQWQVAKTMAPATLAFPIPAGLPKVLGYVSQQFNIYRGEATQSFKAWIDKMPAEVSKGLLDPLSVHADSAGSTLDEPARTSGAELGTLQNFHSLVPHAQTMRRAIFELEVDKVIRGNQYTRALDSETEFRELCDQIIART